MIGGEGPLLPGKAGGKEEGRRRGCLLKGAYGWGGAGGGGGNRKETEARDMRSKVRAWWSPTPRPAGTGKAFPLPGLGTILVA